jgi:putative membrane protein
MKHTKFYVPAAAVAVALMLTPARAATSDTAFAAKAAAGGMAEVQMGELAKTKGNSQAVRDLGEKLVTDHTKAGDQLKSIMTKDNMTLPTAMDATAQAEYNKLQSLSGADFDREFVNHAIKDHKEDINLFQQEVNHGTNPAIKNWASQELPTLHEHLRMAEAAHKQIMSGK